MKIFSKNQFVVANQVLIGIVSAVFGYNLYQAIVHPEKSHLVLSIVLLAMTYFMCRKYGYKPMKEKSDVK